MPTKPHKPDFEDYPTEEWRERMTKALGWCPECADTKTVLDQTTLEEIPCPTCTSHTQS